MTAEVLKNTFLFFLLQQILALTEAEWQEMARGHNILLKQTQASVLMSEQKVNLSYTVITAPCDGVTGHKDIHVSNIKEGAEVSFTADAVPGVVYKGVVVREGRATGPGPHEIPVHEQDASVHCRCYG